MTDNSDVDHCHDAAVAATRCQSRSLTETRAPKYFKTLPSKNPAKPINISIVVRRWMAAIWFPYA